MRAVVVRVRQHLFNVEGSRECFLGSATATQEQLHLFMADTLGLDPN